MSHPAPQCIKDGCAPGADPTRTGFSALLARIRIQTGHISAELGVAPLQKQVLRK